MDQKNTMPSDKLAETVVLAACLKSIDALNQVIDSLDSKAFFHGRNSIIFDACRKLYSENKVVEPYSLISELGSSISHQDASNIINLTDYHDPEVALQSHIDALQKNSGLRKLYYLSMDTSDSIFKDDAKPENIVSKFVNDSTSIICHTKQEEKSYQEILQDYKDGKSFSEYVRDKKARVDAGEQPYHGVKSYFPRLDETIGSFQNGCLHYIGARTSMGKTTFLLNLVKNIMENEPETPIAFLTLEMTQEVIAAKLVCMTAHVSFSSYSNMTFEGNEVEQLYEAADNMTKGNLLLDDNARDIVTLSARIRRLVRVDGVKIVFIDYLTCIKASAGHNTNHEKVNEISKALLGLSKELNIPIVCLAQLNRALTSRVDKTPTLADFRESGSIEEDADVCMLIHRPKYYDDTDTDAHTHIIVAKNRLLGNLTRIKYAWREDKPGCYDELKKIETIRPATASTPKENKNDWSPRRAW